MCETASLTGRRGFCIFPHVAICDEKLKGWELKFGCGRPLCLQLGAFYGAAGDTSWSGKFDVTFCTAEKANGILNKLLMDSPLDTHYLNPRSNAEKVCKRCPSCIAGGACSHPDTNLIHEIKKSVRKFGALAHPIEAIGVVTVDEVHEIGDKRRCVYQQIYKEAIYLSGAIWWRFS